ncbi:MAG: DUF4369 domain-containing protein [Flavobacteriales bacterium]|nr:DUF4369 domain-containing protein [Flavobacteriales bacterium]
MLFLKINCNQQTLKALTFVGAFCLLLTGFSQTVTGKLLGNQSREFIYLSEVIGNKSYKIDSCKITSGDYRFNLQNKPVGYYQLSIQQGNGVEIIYNEKDIVINFADTILQNNLVVLQSEEITYYGAINIIVEPFKKLGKR